MTDARKGMLAWAALLIPTWVVLVLCTHWEPVAHDGWGHWGWHRTEGLSLGGLGHFIKESYVHNNPRLGQVLTLLLYTPGPWHSIVTPVVELALFYVLSVLVLGRRPSLRRADDALLFAAILAMTALTMPMIGHMLFYRPYTGNYLFGLVINLALLVPYRLHFESPRREAWWWAPALFVLGFAAGMCNEHTGPAFAALLALAAFGFWRRGDGIVAWAVAGFVGLVAGGIVLYLAPGQDIRYQGLATQTSMLGRILDRGLTGNLEIFTVWAAWLLPLVAVVAIGVVARVVERPAPQPRNQRIAELALAGLAFAITATLMLSPKLGSRLYLASMVLVIAALAGWLIAQLGSRLSRAIVAVACAAILVWAGYRLVGVYRQLDREFDARVAILEAAPDHSVARIPAYTVTRTRWSVGDDLLIETIRNMVSSWFGLALIEVETGQREPTTPPPADP